MWCCRLAGMAVFRVGNWKLLKALNPVVFKIDAPMMSGPVPVLVMTTSLCHRNTDGGGGNGDGSAAGDVSSIDRDVDLGRRRAGFSGTTEVDAVGAFIAVGVVDVHIPTVVGGE